MLFFLFHNFGAAQLVHYLIFISVLFTSFQTNSVLIYHDCSILRLFRSFSILRNSCSCGIPDDYFVEWVKTWSTGVLHGCTFLSRNQLVKQKMLVSLKTRLHKRLILYYYVQKLWHSFLISLASSIGSMSRSSFEKFLFDRSKRYFSSSFRPQHHFFHCTSAGSHFTYCQAYSKRLVKNLALTYERQIGLR